MSKETPDDILLEKVRIGRRNHKIVLIIGNILIFLAVAKMTYEGLRGILW